MLFRSTVFVAAAVTNSVMLVLFAITADPALALVFAFGTGFGGTLMAGMGNNMLQASVDDAFRGRVMSVWAITFIGLMPVGQLVLGALGSLVGIHAALVIGGTISLASALYAVFRLPLLRQWSAPSRRTAAPTATMAVGQPTLQ